MLRHDRGDTIIEAILAASTLAVVMVSMFSIVQRAMMSSYDSLERSQTRQLINEQAELLNYFRDSYISAVSSNRVIAAPSPEYLWQTIRDAAPSTAIPPVGSCNFVVANDRPFYIVRNGSSYTINTNPTVPLDSLPVPGKGLWIQKVDPQGAAVKRNYHDFYIMACWPSTTGNNQTLSSIVRLYEP
jgi:hypothetical protein